MVFVSLSICLSFLNMLCSVYQEERYERGQLVWCLCVTTPELSQWAPSWAHWLHICTSGAMRLKKKTHRGWRRNLYAKPTPCSLVLIFQCCNNQHHVIAPAKAITIICMSTVSLVFPYSPYREEDSCCFLPFEKKTRHAKQDEEIIKQVMTTWS